jgi:hypothetical protein
MQIAFRILANTPLWVFALLAYLIWQGWQARRPRTQAIWRMLVVPLVFFLMGLSRLVLARDHGLEPLLAGLVAAILFGALGLWSGPKLLTVDRARGVVSRPGSAGSADPQPHGLFAAIWRRGRILDETGAACRRGDHRPRRLRGKRGLLFRVGGSAIAPLPEFRQGRKYRKRKSRLAP